MSGLSRRGFVGASLSPAVYTAAARAAGMAPSDKVRLGLIGCGGISKADTNAFLAHPECEIAAICDVDDAMLAKTLTRLDDLKRPKPDTAKDYRRVIERSDIDVILICTPDHW
ncbi:MAG TPA: Gfo/Idh/MocA family oxidoreductase, partial [Bryobacteraceae bacterium]|nr:Gfo/Idh/MocA family oxidoreductase [Bryobacteraceae bacterium]